MSSLSEDAKKEVAFMRDKVEKVNNELENVGRALGHRVWQTIEAYIANHPDVIKAQEAHDASARNAAIRTAFGDQVVMKVMPKLRGIETEGKVGTKCLENIKSIFTEPSLGLGSNWLEDFDIACKSGHGVFTWSSARYLTPENDDE
ncbi:MAG TPA: hypothetical protein DDZ51_23535 [Planctomycetaceae bacterium]|nr:hypothetical protein [Planctomycetaceae bacterium]